MSLKYLTAFLLCFSLFFVGTYCLKRYFTVPPVEIHVYVDVATGPTLLEMIDFAKRHTDEKIIAWSFYPDISKRLSLKTYNAEEIDYDTTSFDKQLDMFQIRTKLKPKIDEAMHKNPNARFVFHTNFRYVGYMLNPILEDLNKENIKHIYVYEDGYGNTAGSKRQHFINFNQTNIPDDVWDERYPLFVHQKYPITYKLAFTQDIFEDAELKNITDFIGPYIENIDYENLAKTLTFNEKQIIERLIGFNAQKWRETFKQCANPSVILLGPHSLSTEEMEAQLNLLSDLLKDTKYCWFFKPHPSRFAQGLTHDLKKRFPKLEIIPASIPAEAFLLTDSMPDYIAGYSSSVFYAMPKDKILSYIARPNDTYLPLLLKKNIITSEQILYLDDFFN